MLPELIEYADKHNLVKEVFLRPKTVKWHIHVQGDGEIKMIAAGEIKGKKHIPKEYNLAPYTSPVNLKSRGKAHFLSDTLSTVLLMTPYEQNGNEVKFAAVQEKQREKQAYFVNLMKTSSQAVGELEPLFKPVIDLIGNKEKIEAINVELAKIGASPNDTVSFICQGVDLLSSAYWHEWWRQAYVETNDTPYMICLATGKIIKPLKKGHGPIRGVPGLPAQKILIANDKGAYQSYGLERSLNAAISSYAEAHYVAALNRLLKNGMLLGKNSKLIYWTKETVDFDVVKTIGDPISKTNKPAISFLAARKKQGADTSTMELGKGKVIVEAIDKGEKPIAGGAEFYAATLSGNGARIVVRDWIEMGMEDLYQNVSEWFFDLELVRLTSPGLIPFPKLGRILYLLVRDNLKELPDTVAPQIMRAAVTGGQITRQALQLALHRHQIEIVAGRKLLKGKITYDPVPERIAFIKLAINRLQKNNKGGIIMTTELNTAENDKAYLCGRMLALFGKIQKEALGDVNVGVVQRFYGSASATPALVMGRLYKTMRYHLGNSNINDTSRQDFEEEVKEITNLLDIAEPKNQWPLTLTLEEQGRFALGYYHQLAKLK